MHGGTRSQQPPPPRRRVHRSWERPLAPVRSRRACLADRETSCPPALPRGLLGVYTCIHVYVYNVQSCVYITISDAHTHAHARASKKISNHPKTVRDIGIAVVCTLIIIHACVRVIVTRLCRRSARRVGFIHDGYRRARTTRDRVSCPNWTDSICLHTLVRAT